MFHQFSKTSCSYLQAPPVCQSIGKTYVPYLKFLVQTLGPERATSELFCGMNVDEACLSKICHKFLSSYCLMLFWLQLPSSRRRS